MLLRGNLIVCVILDKFTGLDLSYTDLVQHNVTEGHNLDFDLPIDRVLSELYLCDVWKHIQTRQHHPPLPNLNLALAFLFRFQQDMS